MRKNILTIIICFICSYYSLAQNKMTSNQMIGITPIICSTFGLPTDAVNSLNQKLLQMVTKNGFGSISGEIILTANPVITNKQMSSTVPQQFIVDVDLSIYVVNFKERIVVNEITIPLKGINRIENKAFIFAINSLNANSPKVRNFMNQTRSKIIDYYSTKIPTIISTAKSMAYRSEDKEAFSLLAKIPNFVSQYPEVLELMNSIHAKVPMLDTAALMQQNRVELDSISKDSAIQNDSSVDETVAAIIGAE